MHVSMTIRRGIVLFAVLAAASACVDSASAPRPIDRPALDINALQPDLSRVENGPGPKGQKAAPTAHTDTSVKTFEVDPNVSKSYAFGQDWIYFPAHSICDPMTSGYGMDLWDAPCTPVTQPIQITVHWSARGGHSFVHFSPELRFAPADAQDVSRWVVLSLHDHRQLLAQDSYSILYNPSGTETWIDESLTDPTLRAWIDWAHNSVYRRVKHFSGYMVAAGYSGVGGMGDASY